jgi:membrane protein DedA with SNARE-associated domain
MPYRRFVAFNAPAATLWAAIFLTLGVLAGNSWHIVENWTSRVSLLVAAAIVLAVGYVIFSRWLARRRP